MLCKIAPLKNSKAAGIFAVEFAQALVAAEAPFAKPNVETCAELAKKNAAAVFESSKEARPASLMDVYGATKVQRITPDAVDSDDIAGHIALHAVAAKTGGVIVNESEGFAATFAGTDSNFVFFNPKSGQITKSCGDLQQDVRTLLAGLKAPFQLYFVLPSPPPAVILKKEEGKEEDLEETAVTAKRRLEISGGATPVAPSEEEPTIEKEKDPAPKKRAYRKRPAPPAAAAAGEHVELAAAPKVAKLVEEASNGSVKE